MKVAIPKTSSKLRFQQLYPIIIDIFIAWIIHVNKLPFLLKFKFIFHPKTWQTINPHPHPLPPFLFPTLITFCYKFREFKHKEGAPNLRTLKNVKGQNIRWEKILSNEIAGLHKTTCEEEAGGKKSKISSLLISPIIKAFWKHSWRRRKHYLGEWRGVIIDRISHDGSFEKKKGFDWKKKVQSQLMQPWLVGVVYKMIIRLVARSQP